MAKRGLHTITHWQYGKIQASCLMLLMRILGRTFCQEYWFLLCKVNLGVSLIWHMQKTSVTQSIWISKCRNDPMNFETNKKVGEFSVSREICIKARELFVSSIKHVNWCRIFSEQIMGIKIDEQKNVVQKYFHHTQLFLFFFLSFLRERCGEANVCWIFCCSIEFLTLS